MKLKLITFTLKMCMAIVIMTVSAISLYQDADNSSRYIYYTMSDVWICVFLLAILNIIELTEREIK